MKISERILRETIRPQFPQLSIKFTVDEGHTLIMSTGQKLQLGKVHHSALEDLFLTVNLINRLAEDPKMISAERINSQLN